MNATISTPSADSSIDENPAISAVPGAAARRTGWLLSGFALAFLAFDASIKLLQLSWATHGTEQLGWPVSAVFALGLVQAACWIAYAVPRTSVLGAILWTGYLGGAVATHARIGDPLFSHVLFPTYVAVLLWGGLWLRNARLRALLPLTHSAAPQR